MVVVAEVVLAVGSLGARLVCLGKRMCRRVRALVLLRRRVSLLVMLLVNYTRGSRVLLQVLGRRLTLLLVLRVMLHREKTH